MLTSKLTLYVQMDQDKSSNIKEVVEKLTNKKKGHDVKFDVIDYATPKSKRETEQAGFFINIIKDTKEPVFAFREAMQSLSDTLKAEIDQTDIMSFIQQIDDSKIDEELTKVSETFIDCVANNAAYYIK